MTQVVLIGSGGVGTIASLALFLAGKATVSSILRSDYDLVNSKGFTINSSQYGHFDGWKPHNVFKSIDEAAEKLPSIDYIVISTKSLQDILRVDLLIKPLVKSPETTILLLQNGFGIERDYIKQFPKNVILSGVSMIGSHKMNGVIDHMEPDRTVIGYFENNTIPVEKQEAKAKEYIRLYTFDKNIGMLTYDDSVKFSRWRKLVYNAVFNPIAAITGLDAGRLELSGTTDSLVRPAMDEVIRAAKADGVDLPSNIADFMIHSDDGHWFKPSMLVDELKGNPIESEAILGNTLRRAKELNVETPILDTIYKLLKCVQYRLKEQNGYIKLPEKRPSGPPPKSADPENWLYDI